MNDMQALWETKQEEIEKLEVENARLRAELAAEIKRAVRLAAALAKSEAELAAVAGERDRYRRQADEMADLVINLRIGEPTGSEWRRRLKAVLDEHERNLPLALAPASLQPEEASEREIYRAALLQVRVWTSTPKGLTDRKAQLAAIRRIADDALASPPPAGEAT